MAVHKAVMGADLADARTSTHPEPRTTVGLTAADAEWFDGLAAMKREAVEVCNDPIMCAEYAAEAAGLESLAARLRETAAHGISLLEQGQGGETAPPPDADMRGRYRVVAEAVGARPTMLAADASLIRLSLARDANVLTTAIETAQDAGAETATQKMIAHQLAAAHPLAMELLTAAATEVQKCRLSPHHNPESLAEAARTTTAAARLMDSFARGALILDRLRNGARQSVLVQHVMVSDGAVHAPAAAAVARAAATGLGDHLVQSMPAIAAAVRRAG